MYAHYIYVCFLCTGAGTNMLTSVNASIDQLRRQYISTRFSFTMDDWPPYQVKHYTSLTLIHSRKKSLETTVTQKPAITEKNVPEFVPQTVENYRRYFVATKNISDIFELDPNMVLIEGTPGMGKTVLAKEIAFQWAKNQLLSTKKLLFLVFLCECNNIASIEGFLQYIIKSNEMVGCLAKYLLQTEGKNLVIILDGYDEMSNEDRKNSFIVNIINRQVFPKCCLVITTCPTSSLLLHNLADNRVEIAGFTEEDRFNFIQESLEGRVDQIQALKKCLWSNPTINALCYVPLNMTILLFLGEGGMVMETLTDMHKAFVEITIQRVLRKINEKSIADICCISKLPYPCNEVFKEVAQLAFEALRADKKVFTLTEIGSSYPHLTKVPSNWNGLGLLKASRCYNSEINCEEVTFHFLQFSIQEFMAACYISSLSHKKQISLLKEMFWEQRYYNTWIMYAGITGAAFRHFLSGNITQSHTKSASTFIVSGKLLKNKLKCLQIFCCLEETKDKDAEILARKILQNRTIDLSNQPLLPSDLNALAFFLCRSTTKQWEALNLSKCNIGVKGCDFLYYRFLDKDNHNIVCIKKVNFSNNQLTYSCLLRLLNLFKSWHTSEVIIADEVAFNHTTLVASIEENFITCKSQNAMSLLVVGSFFYANKMKEKEVLDFLSNATGMRSLYLMHCRWEPEITEVQEWYAALNKQKINKIHVVGAGTSGSFISALASLISTQRKSINLFVHDPFLSDIIAHGIVDFSLTNKSRFDSRLVISSSKIKGVVVTQSLNNELSPLELLNLGVCIRSSNHLEICLWRENIYIHSGINKLVLCNIFDHLVFNRTCSHHLRIALVENDIVLATRATVEDIAAVITPNQKLKLLLYNCNLHVSQFETENIFAFSTSLYIINSRLSEYTTVLAVTGALIQELFIHGIIDIETNDLVRLVTNFSDSISALVVTNDMMIGHNPTAKQVALAFQLEPSTKVWKLPNCQVTVNVLYQLMYWLTAIPNNWAELDFEGCYITTTECKISNQYLSNRGGYSTVSMLNISSNQLTNALIPYLISMILIWKVQKCVLDGINQNFLIKFIKRLRKVLCLTYRPDSLCLSVTNHGNAYCFIYNGKWHEMPILNSHVKEVYIVNCHFPSVDQKKVKLWLKRSNLLKVFVSRSTLCKSFLTTLLKKHKSTNTEITFCDTTIADTAEGIYSCVINKHSLNHTSMSFLMLTNTFMCGLNLTHDQTELFSHGTKDNTFSLNHSIAQLMQELKSVSQTELFVIQNEQPKVIHFIGKEFNVCNYSKSIVNTMHTNVSTLTRFGIENFCITDECASDVAAVLSFNKNINEVYLIKNNLQAKGCAIIIRALKKTTSLHKLYFSKNSMTNDTAKDMATVLTQNSQIEELDLGNNKLKMANSIQILSSLVNHVNLKVLRLANSNLNNQTAAKLIGHTLEQNNQIRELDLSGNHLQAFGCAIIFRALLNVSTLCKLYLSDNNITDLSAEILATVFSKNAQIEELDISYNKLTAPSVAKIVQAMKFFLNLKILRMTCSNINLPVAKFIASVLWYSKMQELDLNENYLQSSGCAIVCKALQNLSTITKLNLSNNGITDEAADDVASVLSSNKQLKDIDVKGNHFQAKSVAKFAKALKNTSSLNKLYIGTNNITNEAVDDIVDILSHNSKLQELEIQLSSLLPIDSVKLSNALQHTLTLRIVILINSNISSESAGSVAAILCHNTQLQVLNLDGNYLQLEGTRKVLKSLNNTTTLIGLSLRDNHCTSKATGDIIHVVSQNTALQELMLCGNDLDAENALYIAKALWKNTSSPNTDLGNMIGFSEML